VFERPQLGEKAVILRLESEDSPAHLLSGRLIMQAGARGRQGTLINLERFYRF
jgi:hypothetical protein